MLLVLSHLPPNPNETGVCVLMSCKTICMSYNCPHRWPCSDSGDSCNSDLCKKCFGDDCCHWSPFVNGLITGNILRITSGTFLDIITLCIHDMLYKLDFNQVACCAVVTFVFSVCVWDVIILCPNAIFLLYLVVKMRTAVLKLHRTSSPVLTTFFLLVSILSVSCILWLTSKSLLPNLQAISGPRVDSLWPVRVKNWTFYLLSLW